MNQIDTRYQPPQSAFNQHQQQLHPQQSQHFFPNSGPSPGPAFSHPPPGPQARFQQQQQQQQYQQQQHQQHQNQRQSSGSGFGPQATGANVNHAAMMQAGLQQLNNQSKAFTSASYPPAVSAPTPSPAPRAVQHSQSPHSQHLQQGQTQSPPQFPMAAPKLSQAQQSPRTSAKPSSLPHSPQSATSASDDNEKIALTLDINAELLHEINNLQAQGKGGAQSPQQAEIFRNKGLSDKMASADFIQTCQRLHSNLGYLLALSEANQNKSKGPHPPTFMRAPPNMPGLQDKYARLRQLFPGWLGQDGQVSPKGNGAMR